jgi:hypothetical protein
MLSAAGAAAAFEQLLADCLRVLGDDHPSTPITRYNPARQRNRHCRSPECRNARLQ